MCYSISALDVRVIKPGQNQWKLPPLLDKTHAIGPNRSRNLLITHDQVIIPQESPFHGFVFFLRRSMPIAFN